MTTKGNRVMIPNVSKVWAWVWHKVGNYLLNKKVNIISENGSALG